MSPPVYLGDGPEQPSDVRHPTVTETKRIVAATREQVQQSSTLEIQNAVAAARMDSIKMLLVTATTAVGIASTAFFALDARSDTKDAGVAAQADKALTAYAKSTDSRLDRIERAIERVADGQDAIGRKFKVTMPRRDAGDGE